MTDQPCLEVPFDEVEKWEKIEGSCARLYAAAEWGYKKGLSTPPPEPLRPIPVSERLPGPGDCAPWPGEPDATPWCWAGKRIDDGWEWAQISMLGRANSLRWCIAGGGWSHWLPYNAIPFPEVTQ